MDRGEYRSRMESDYSDARPLVNHIPTGLDLASTSVRGFLIGIDYSCRK